MKHIVFADPESDDAKLAKLFANEGNNNMVLLPSTEYRTDQCKAVELIRQAPAYTSVNGVLMTAERGAQLDDVIKLFKTRKKRG